MKKLFYQSLIAGILILSTIGQASAQVGEVNTGNVRSFSTNDKRYIAHKSGRFNVAFKSADLKDTLRFLSKIAGINVLIPEEIASKPITVNLSDIDLLEAINVILKSNTLDYAIEGNILRVGRSDEFKSEQDLMTSTLRLKYATAKEIEPSIKELLSDKGKIISDSRTNTITVKDISDNVSVVKQMVSVIDIEDAQVLIQAKIVQVNTDFLRDIGVQWGFGNTGSSDTVQVGGLPTTIGESDNANGLIVNLPAGSPTTGIGLLLGRFGNFQIDTQLTAAESRGDVRIVSKPSIVTSNGKAASIRSGETLLIKTLGSTAGAAGELKEIKTGVELQVTPQISIDNQVKLSIAAVTSLADFSRQIDGIPIIVDNQANTTVLVRDGETTVIGGLLQFQKQKSSTETPYLSRIPLLGALFRQKFNKNKNIELMVFIKPTIIRRMPIKIGYPYPDDPETAAEPAMWPSINMNEEKVKKSPKKQKSASNVSDTNSERPLPDKYAR